MSKKIIFTEKAPAPIGPYNQAVSVGNMLFASGQIAIVPATGELITGDVEREAKQVMENIASVLEAANFAFTDIAKASIFLKSMDDFGKVNAIYGEYFENSTAPARECVEVARLPKDVSVEISVIAIKS